MVNRALEFLRSRPQWNCRTHHVREPTRPLVQPIWKRIRGKKPPTVRTELRSSLTRHCTDPKARSRGELSGGCPDEAPDSP